MPAVGDLIYTHTPFKGWRAVKIVGETNKCWALPDGGKVNKRTMLQGRKLRGKEQPRWFDKAGKDDMEFCWRWSHQIGAKVQRCTDAAALRTIAAMVKEDLK
jgi:hypothetical protein